MHLFQLKPDTVETTPITGVTGYDKPLKVVTIDDPLLEISDEQLPEFAESGLFHLFELVDSAKEPTDDKAELQARYKELSGEDADKRWSVKKLTDAIVELEAAANSHSGEPRNDEETEGVE